MLTRRSLLSMLSAGIASVAVSTRLAASELKVVETADEFTRWMAEPDSDFLLCRLENGVPRAYRVNLPAFNLFQRGGGDMPWALLEISGHDRADFRGKYPLLKIGGLPCKSVGPAQRTGGIMVRNVRGYMPNLRG